MIWIVVGLISLSVSLMVLGVSVLVSNPEARLVRRRLHAVPGGAGRVSELRERRRRRARREALESFLEAFGKRVEGKRGQHRSVRMMLVHAGYRRPNAAIIYLGTRAVMAGAMLAASMPLAALFGASPAIRLFMMFAAALTGWMAPFLVVRRRMKLRQAELQRTLPDALDLMVVCVEAGLGLNQALVRAGEEMERVSRALAEEFTLVNLEMRAGTPRAEALRNLGERTGIADIRAFVAMLIQTDRFGTSIAGALRIHADELRTRRRQRAEEAAAKLTVKMLIPIVLFIFPAIFVVILGPAAFHLVDLFRVLGAP